MRILFVCHGNICRSPMAEFVLKRMLEERGVNGVWVESAATSDEEIFGGVGNPVYPPARRELAKHGIFCDGKRARQLTRADYDAFDLLICMDRNNLRNMMRLFGEDRAEKLHLLMDYTARGGEVADPWYSGRFDVAYADIYEGCAALLETLDL